MQNPNDLAVMGEARILRKGVWTELVRLKNDGFSEYHRLHGQLFGCSTAIAAGLGEFCGMTNKNQQRQKLESLISELNEVETWLDFLQEINKIEDIKYKALINQVKKIRMMILNLRKSVLEDLEMEEKNAKKE